MTDLFKTYLEIAHNPGNVKELARVIPNELGYRLDGTVQSVKELLLTEAIESTTLIQDEAYRTVIQGSEPAKCMGNALQTIQMKSNVMNFTIGETGTYASVVAEGAEIPINTQNYSTVEFKALKYGVRPLISMELIEDGLFNVAELELQKAGMRIENSKNQVAIGEIIDCGATELDMANTNIGIKAVAQAVSTVRSAGFNPDTLIMHPDAEAAVLQEFVPTNYYPTESIVKTGMVPNILGLKTYTCGVTDPASATNVWGYTTATDNIGMIVLDSTAAAAIGMRRDITVDKYNDPIKDLLGMSVTARFDVEAIVTGAMCLVNRDPTP